MGYRSRTDCVVQIRVSYIMYVGNNIVLSSESTRNHVLVPEVLVVNSVYGVIYSDCEHRHFLCRLIVIIVLYS